MLWMIYGLIFFPWTLAGFFGAVACSNSLQRSLAFIEGSLLSNIFWLIFLGIVLKFEGSLNDLVPAYLGLWVAYAALGTAIGLWIRLDHGGSILRPLSRLH